MEHEKYGFRTLLEPDSIAAAVKGLERRISPHPFQDEVVDITGNLIEDRAIAA